MRVSTLISYLRCKFHPHEVTGPRHLSYLIVSGDKGSIGVHLGPVGGCHLSPVTLEESAFLVSLPGWNMLTPKSYSGHERPPASRPGRCGQRCASGTQHSQLTEPPASSRGQLSGRGPREHLLAGPTLRAPATAPPPSSLRQEQAREGSHAGGQRTAPLVAGHGFHGDSWGVRDPTELPL